jgi:16S rRNA (uracil1498-N3)-methyltransferase
MNVFYLDNFNISDCLLNEEESGHAIRVLRLKENDAIIAVDGKGNRYEAQISVADAKRCRIRITGISQEFEKRNYRLHLAVAPTKNSDRMEWLIEKATEIGLDEFTPLCCRYSERKNIQRNRLERVAIAAMKQSLKAFLPEINEIIDFEKFIPGFFNGKKFIAHCYPGEKPYLHQLVSSRDNGLVLIGPEGDFSTDEIELARKHGFQEVSLGTSRLRTETAALVACHTLALCNIS